MIKTFLVQKFPLQIVQILFLKNLALIKNEKNGAECKKFNFQDDLTSLYFK